MSSKKKALTLTIPEPCSENFNKMTPVKGGKFCGECEKTIVDFRPMNDYQILRFYEQNNGKICGVFNQQQLNRAMPFPLEVAPSKNWKAVAALAAGLLFSGGLVSQTTPVGVPTVSTQNIKTTEQDKDSNSDAPNQIIKGRVIDENQEGLIGANIIIEGTTIGISTDLEGFFELIVPANLKEMDVTVSYVGYEPQTLLFNEKYPIPDKQIEIELASPFMEHVIMGIMIAHDFEEAPTCGDKEIIELEEIPEITPDRTTAKNIPTENQMTVFPNPFVGNLKVSYDYMTKGDYLFHLYDTNGGLLFAKSYSLLKGNQTIELDMASKNLGDGVYILQISDNQDRILATKKVYKGQT